MCSLEGAVSESINLARLSYFSVPIPADLRYIEMHQKPRTIPNFSEFIQEFNKPPVRMNTETRVTDKKQLINELQKYQRFYDKAEARKPGNCCVPAFKIKADTRLDEAVYHLTKKELTGQIEKERDTILHSLSFKAGITKATLS